MLSLLDGNNAEVVHNESHMLYYSSSAPVNTNDMKHTRALSYSEYTRINCAQNDRLVDDGVPLEGFRRARYDASLCTQITQALVIANST